MTLVNLATVLSKAKEGKYAVGAFNATDLNTARGIVEAAEQEKSPIILQFAESHSKYISLEQAANMYLDLATRACVPICVHLDHGENFNTIIRAIKLGFTSVMVDASLKPFEENIQNTKEIVKIAQSLGISVEAELGVMNAEDGSGSLDYNTMDDTYTSVQEAKEFVQKTKIDALAIAFGTVHGLYKKEPNLNYERIKAIQNCTDMPLVMHGGSGLSNEEYQQSVANGITKINYYSTMSFEVTNGLRNYLNSNSDAFLFDVDAKTIELVKNNIAEKIQIFGSSNKA
ncbi:class II fructose-bisphosphate aldolase [Tetragenococcus koreensis]|uniref:class II fructose-bisphosphate aldolase n=1 Tax=Tetragenococcus koreensis TaxID=290335 RepID=UPI000F5043A2|nr:class II fructose-bisphosphate aldolase [Tetragenococcus koreensis]MDN6630127.1 class II fructose-bisphosphate aldolase [Staphylococcus equorum]AYW46568.1 ketose-bisphosphate aldolase [Tetragenococcus koreensis]MCF1585602.1 class II fructose-bisphosphate aldolase [Tetragenococcus koreensis]MCF1615202.1 class II fructose-bisphosphate aldolase [Tetragenococcus koreensis]MCF1620233.1 class II fructose-bisphosphate aldolase [Tetragenococcus koreensis]